MWLGKARRGLLRECLSLLLERRLPVVAQGRSSPLYYQNIAQIPKVVGLLNEYQSPLAAHNTGVLSFATVPLRHRRNQNKARNQKPLPPKNEEISAKELRVVFPEKENETKVMSLEEARAAAKERGLDLVMASPTANPPVARIVSWEKTVYSMRQKQKASERTARENKRLAIPKELRIGSKIAAHDMSVKLSTARKILENNHVLKISVVFKGGREIEPAKEVMMQIAKSLEDIAKLKDPKHLQKPQMNRWVVQFEPLVSNNKDSTSTTSTLSSASSTIAAAEETAAAAAAGPEAP